MPGFIPNWSANVDWLNVKDFGATGNGSIDDRAAIQACFDAAFGSVASDGHGQGAYINKGVWFPSGNYQVSSPLYVTNVSGIIIQGQTAQIYYTGDGTQGNVLDATNPGYTPILMLDGVVSPMIVGLSFNAPVANRKVVNMIGIYCHQRTGSHGAMTAPIFYNVGVQNVGCGILAGGVVNVENGVLINVQFNTCGYYGLRMDQPNAINWQVYGGGASNCALLSRYNPDASTDAVPTGGAAYSSGGGAIGVISGVSCSGNQWDIISSGAQQMAVFGGSFEGSNYYHANLVWSGGTVTLTTQVGETIDWARSIGDTVPIHVSGNTPSGYNGNYTGTITGTTTLTYPLAGNPGPQTVVGFVTRSDAGSISSQSSVIHLSGVTYRPPGSDNFRWLDCQNSGQIGVYGCSYAPPASNGAGRIATLGNNGLLVMDACELQPSGTDGVITGASNSRAWLRGIKYDAAYATLFSSFTGFVVEWDMLFNTTFSGLPTANAKFKGLRGSITDSSVTTFLTNAAGGGSTTVPVFCDGTNWKVG